MEVRSTTNSSLQKACMHAWTNTVSYQDSASEPGHIACTTGRSSPVTYHKIRTITINYCITSSTSNWSTVPEKGGSIPVPEEAPSSSMRTSPPRGVSPGPSHRVHLMIAMTDRSVRYDDYKLAVSLGYM